MVTVVGLVLLAMVALGMAFDRLDKPNRAAPECCPDCGWPTESVLPCLCSDKE